MPRVDSNAPSRVGQLVRRDDPETERPRRVEPAGGRRLAQDGARMSVRRPVAHHPVDHRRALVAGDGRVVGLELRRLGLESSVGQARLVGQQHREQLGGMADPLAEHPEGSRPDGVVVHEPHPVEPAGPVRGRVERRIGDRVVERHPVDRGDADGARDSDDLRPGPVRERVVVADGSAGRGPRCSRRGRR